MKELIINTTAKKLSEEKISALRVLTAQSFFSDWEEKNGGMEIELINNSAVYRKMLLTNCSAGAELCGCNILGGTLSYSDTRKEYTLALETEEEGKYYLRFNDVVFTENQCYNIVSTQHYHGNPWTYLVHIAILICAKAHYASDLLNQKEKKLLPVLQELKQISVFDKDCKFEFPILLDMVDKYGYGKTKKYFEKAKNSRIKEVALAELTNVLSQIEYKPLWDEIFNDIKESQKEYPPLPLKNNEHKKIVDAVMEKHGFSGVYPDYVKVSKTKGIINENSYGVTYTIANEKNAVCRVHCKEYAINGNLAAISFLCGTAFLKEGASAESADIYHCAFNAKGKTLLNTVEYHAGHGNGDLETAATVAAKRAERVKLTKAERKYQRNYAPSFMSAFLPMFILGGGFFSIGFTLISALVVIITALATGENIGEFLRDMPWLFVIVFPWVGFGGTMGIITALSNRK